MLNLTPDCTAIGAEIHGVWATATVRCVFGGVWVLEGPTGLVATAREVSSFTTLDLQAVQP